MIQIVKPGSNYPFIKNAHIFGIISGMLVLGSLLLLFTKGLNKGIDFKGGNKLIVAFATDAGADRDSIKQVVADLVGSKTELADGGQIEVQDFDVGETDLEGNAVVKYQIYTELTTLLDDGQATAISDKLKATFTVESMDRPQETDKFIMVLKENQPVSATKDKVLAVLKELGYTKAEVTSEEERSIDMEFYKEYNLSVQERTKEGKEIPEDDFANASKAQGEKKRKVLAQRGDRVYTLSLQQIQADVEEALTSKFGKEKVNVESATSVSPSVGEDLFFQGILAMFYAIIGILIYIGLRFDFRFSPGAVAALIHDTVIVLGIFSAFGIKFTLPIVSALLTIIGYSLNDTIVVYDRIRENYEKFHGMELGKLINQSINETLSRTLLTSITTLFVVVALLVWGGGLIGDLHLP